MSSEHTKNAVVENAEAIVAGNLGIIEGCVRLAALAHDAVPNWASDKDFVVFGAVASETDHLPTGSARKYWNASALAEADVDIARIEESARADVLKACYGLIERFKNA